MPLVLHVSDFAASYPGAFITQLRMLDEELRRRAIAHCAYVFPPRAEHTDWYRQLSQDGFETFTVDPTPRGGMVAAANDLMQIVEGSKACVVHTHFGSYDLAAALAAWRLRRRGRNVGLLWHYRTALEEGVENRSLQRRVKDLVRYRMARRSVDGCLAVTEALADEAARRGLGAKALAVTAGCDTETFRPAPSVRSRVRAAMGLQPDDILILHLGWAWHRKGGDLLVAAAEDLRQRGHTGLIFASVGATDTGSSLVRSLPFTDQVQELHQAADIFVSSSRSEGFGNGVVEAMATGTVVVAALATGQREIFEGVAGCVAVAVDDPVCLADGIADLIARRKDWPALGAMNRAHVLAHYDMRDWARRMADVYEQVLDAQAVLP